MADAPFEIPQQIRDLTEQNIKQARAAYGQFMDAMNQAVAIEPSGGGFQGLMFLGDRGMVAVGSQLAADGYGSLVQKGC